MRSPGRPRVAGRAEQQRFWKAIARGLSSEEAAVSCGVSSPVGGRWFREGGGMPPISLAPPSARYLCFAEREEIALVHNSIEGRWCMKRNWPATILTQRLLTCRYRTTLARQGPSSDLGCCMRAAPRPFALLACALEGQCR